MAEGKSIAEHLSAAFDAATGDDAGEHAPEAEPTTEVPADAPEVDGVSSTPHDDVAPEAETAPPPVEAAGEQKSIVPKPGKAGKGAATAPAAPEAGPKAPQSWPAPVRELWKDTPGGVRVQVDKREREIDLALKATVNARRLADGLTKTLEPYRAFMRGDPLQEIDGLFRTAVSLRTGDDETRAAIAANIITNFKVPIQRLAEMLGAPAQGEDGAAPQGTQPPATQARQPEPKEFRDPEFAAFKENLKQHTMAAQAAERQRKREELEAFANSGKAEFFQDVMEEMLVVQEAADRRGEQISPEQLYERACILNASVRPLWEQRRAASQAAANVRTASTQPRTRVATSSVRHEPTAPPSGAKGPTSLREQLLANWEKAEARR